MTVPNTLQTVAAAVSQAESALKATRARLAKVEEDLEAVQVESHDVTKTGVARDELMHRIQNLQHAESTVTAAVSASEEVRSSVFPPPIYGLGHLESFFLSLLLKIIFVGSKYPKCSFFFKCW